MVVIVIALTLCMPHYALHKLTQVESIYIWWILSTEPFLMAIWVLPCVRKIRTGKCDKYVECMWALFWHICNYCNVEDMIYLGMKCLFSNERTNSCQVMFNMHKLHQFSIVQSASLWHHRMCRCRVHLVKSSSKDNLIFSQMYHFLDLTV